MNCLSKVGKAAARKDGMEKVTGKARYTNDYEFSGLLHARIVTSPYAHAKIKSIDIKEALKAYGVRAVLTGKEFHFLMGSTIMDKPPIAVDKVRYYGETVAVVVADSEIDAKRGAELIKVEYEPLPVVNSPIEALKSGMPLVHENLGKYRIIYDVYPKPHTNIANHTRIHKGNIKKGWDESEVVVETSFSFPQSDHAAMETRCCISEILPDGRVIIHTSSQSPFHVKELISTYFNIPPEKVIVNVPLVGGAYGGKTPVYLEVIAYLSSRAVGGRPVKIANSREDDFINSPVHIGLDAKIKLGSTKKGRLRAVKITYLFDGGTYSDRAVIISRAAAVDCTGPYNIDNVRCDSLCMYTNHPFATAFRGFGHSELSFVIERTIDIMANKLGMDPLELRLKNAIVPGDTTPTQTTLNPSNVGNLPECINRLAELINWSEEERIKISEHKVRAKGVSCFWKTSNTPTDAGAGAVLTFNSDGSINLNCGAVEIGQGTKTALAQILAEKMKMDVEMIHVVMEVNTNASPKHWKTAASMSTFLVGRAVLNAAEDAICQP